MPNTFIFATIGYLLLAVASVTDKFILTKSLKSVSSYVFYSTIFFFGAFLFWPFSESISFYNCLIAIISGLSFGFATWAMFTGLKRGEATHIVPFLGAVTAVFVYGLSYLILHEVLNVNQTIGVVFLVIASFTFSFEKSKKHNGFHSGYVFAIVSGLLFAFSHVTAKYFYGEYNFLTGIVWTKGSVGIVALIALLSLSARREIFGKKSNGESKVSKNSLYLIFSNKVFGVLGTLGIQYAIAIGSVTVVNALAGFQYALVLLLAFLLTKFYPRTFSEYSAKGEMRLQIFAVILVVIGMIFLN